ncbi:MAG: tol-pal system-associated acyl-CoA thioesterase [Gallionella sp.]
MNESAVFSLPMRVYFQDTDAGGVVYHASYVNFMERARTEWLRSCGYSNAGLMHTFGLLFVVRSLKMDYLKPALLDDLLEVSAQIQSTGRSQLLLKQTVCRDGVVLTAGDVQLVCVEKETFKPVRIPEVLRDKWLAAL